jgi:retron-type reverse transcriptase
LAYKNARKGKTKRRYVKRFERDLQNNLLKIQQELIDQTYIPNKLKVFTLRDPKTRKISKSAFRDRVIHHALCNIIVPILEKPFIYDSCANQIGKGTLKALDRFDFFKRKVSRNNTRKCWVLKADIKHYFEEINHKILVNMMRRKIQDEKVIWLIWQILSNPYRSIGVKNKPLKKKGMPLGNLTSQFFANLYLNELDQFVKHQLKVKYYIRYVDDFVILHENKEQLKLWKEEINDFIKEKLNIELHPSKSHVLNLNSGISFLGFRIFYHFRLLRKSNMKNFEKKFNQMKILYEQGILNKDKVIEKLEGWLEYASKGNTFKFRKHILRNFNSNFPYQKEKTINNKAKYRNFIRKVKENYQDFSCQQTLFMFKKGFSIKEISLKRGIKESTIWGHLANLIEHRQISLFEVLNKDKICRILSKIYSRKDRLKDIKSRLNKFSASFDEIACVMASIKSRNKYKSPRRF